MNTTEKIKNFEFANKAVFNDALNEMKHACKKSHWMWCVFPQVFGFGKNEKSYEYAICSFDEAKAFLSHPVLGNNLREICAALMNLNGTNATRIFGEDYKKLRSSMTLFNAIQPDDIFKQVIDKYFNGEGDKLTLCRMSLESRVKNALDYIGVDAKDFNIVPSMYDRHRGEAMHRFSHIYRVMIGTALIAHKIGEARLGLLAFIAAFIHDLSRDNDGNDPQHGRRAAETKLPKLTHILSKYNITKEEYGMIADAATYHCERIDKQMSDEGYKVCKILSDADALDRCRFRHQGRLNRDYLYFPESHRCIAPIEFVFKESVRHGKINNEIPFAEFLKVTEF